MNDPRALGAQCDACPLGPQGCLRGQEAWAPVSPEIHEGASVLAVQDTPDLEDSQIGRPLAGRAGSEWAYALSAIHRKRNDVDLTYVISCKPPGAPKGALERMSKRLVKLNKKRMAQGKAPHPTPQACCRPKLMAEAAQYTHLLAMGKESVFALTRSSLSLSATRGGPMWVDDTWSHVTEDAADTHGVRKVFPTHPPTYVGLRPSWRPVLHADLGKAFRWFNGELRWIDPEVLWRPAPEDLEAWLAQPAPFWTYDVETDGIISMECGLRTLSIAIPDLDADGRVARPEKGRPIAQHSRVVGITFMSTQGHQWMEPDIEARIKDILRQQFFLDPLKIKVGHNAGFFDRLVVEHHFGVTPAPLWDTLFPARFRAPDLPKGLKMVGSVLTDVERWESTTKGDKAATGSSGDDPLLRYNCIDSVVNARITPPLVDAATAVGAFNPLPEALRPPGWEDRPWTLWEVDHATQEMCVEMHKSGIWVDQPERYRLQGQFETSVRKRRLRLQSMASPDFNPGSGDQVRRLVYGKWGLECPPRMKMKDFYTESGYPGTNDTVIRGHLSSGLLSEEQKSFLLELRLYRRERNKILGTTLLPMQMRRFAPGVGLVSNDGRVRSNWNAHTTSVARLSSSGPNLQNLGNRKGQGALKRIFAAPPGRIFIGADLDQAHLKITANYWRIPILLEAFTEGKDPHNTLAWSIFGNKFKNATGWGPEGFSLYKKPTSGTAMAMRNVIKTFRYASIYWASPDTVWQVLTATETDDGQMPYLFMEPREVRVFHEKWLESEPEWYQAWQDMLQLYDAQGYMEDPVFKRRSGPLSDGKKNEVVNFPILTAEGGIMRVAEQRIIHAFPSPGDGTGLIHQCHDSVGLEVELPPGLPPGWAPEKGERLPPKLQHAKDYVEWAMTVHVPGWEVPITAEADIGRTLKDI